MSIVVRLTVASALLLAACSTAAPGPAQVDGRTFLSTNVTRPAGPLVGGTRIQLVFHNATDLGASAGCNSIGGTYRIDGGRLAVQAAGMTEMGCDPARHDQDDWLAGFLSANPTLVLNGNDLTLTAGDTTVQFVDREVAQPDLPLVGPTWTLDSILAGDAVSSVPNGVVASFRFTPDGGVELNAGCNQGGGQVTVDGDRIQFARIVTTKRACEAPAGEVEGVVLEVLRSDPLSFRIDASRLTILAPDGRGLGFTGS